MSKSWEEYVAEQQQKQSAGGERIATGALRPRNDRTGGASGSWEQFVQRMQSGQPTASDSAIYQKSGMDALRKDAHTLTGGLTHYFKNKHTANAIDPQYRQKTRAMLDAIANERKYFEYYKDSFTAEDLQKYTAELDEYEAQLKAYDGYFGNGYGRATDKNSAIWGSGYSALSNGLTSFDKDVRGLMQGGRVVTDEAKTDLQRQQQALSSRLSATKRYMEQNAALFTPQERKQWQDEFSRYESYLNGVGSYLTSGQLGMTNPLTGKAVPVPNGGLTLEQDRQQREAVQQKITDVIDSFSNAGRLGITAKNAKEIAEGSRSGVERGNREIARLEQQRAEMEQQLKAMPDSEWQAKNALVQQMQEVDSQIEAKKRSLSNMEKRAAAAEAVLTIDTRGKDIQMSMEASVKRQKELEAQLKQARIPKGRRDGNEWVSEPVDEAEVARLESEIAKEKQQQKLAERRQKELAEFSAAADYYKYYSLKNNEDFKEKSRPLPDVYKYNPKGISDLEQFGYHMAATFNNVSSDQLMQEPIYGYINAMQGRKDAIKKHYAYGTGERDSLESYDYMTADERHIFNYLWATEGKEPAMAFLDTLKPTLDYRHGSADAEEDNGWLIDDLWNPIQRGLRSTARNVDAWFSGEELSTLPWEYETAIRAENAGPLERGVINAASSFGQMLPALALAAPVAPVAGALGASATAAGLLSGGVGAGVTWLTSGAGAYQEGLRQGMSEGQARSYGVLVGASEGLLQFALSGIPGIKGWGVEQYGERAAGKVASALKRTAIKYGASIAGEEIEEHLQNYLEPLFVTMLTGKDYDAPGWDEFVDTTLSVLLLTGATNLATVGSTLKNERAEVEQIKAAQAQFALAALSFDKSSPVYAMGEKVAAALDNKKFLTGQEFRAMLQEAGADQATVDRINKGAFTAEDAEQVAQMAQEAAKRLQTERFEQSYTEGAGAWSKERASAAAGVLYRVWRGENVRNADIQKLHLNTKKGAEALQNALGVPVTKAGNNNVAANQTFREAEMSYRMARSTAKYGDAAINWKTLPPTQESADAIMVHPEAKTALEEIRNKPFTGTYAEQTRQIMQQLSIWWAANASRFTPEAASIQVERWRAEHPQENAQFNIDNAEDSGYTESNGGVSNESDRMAGGMAEGVPGGQFSGRRDAGGRQNGRTNQVFSGRGLSQNLQRAFEQRGVVAAELYNFDADSAAFSAALEAARTADADHGWAVTPQSVEDLQGKTLLMDEGGTIGFAVTADGDIEAVFKNKQLNHTPHAMDGVIPQAIAAGGVKLDCYGKDLVRIYERYGFTPVARVEFNEQYANPGWDASKGTPYIYFMVHNGDSAETVAANIGKYPHMERSQLESLPTYSKEGYDQAAAQRDSLLSWRQQSETSVGAARSGFDQYSHAAIEYGTIEPGENPARVVDVPKSMDGQTRVSTAAAHIMESKLVPDSRLNTVQDLIVSGELSDSVRSLDKLSTDAKALVERDIPSAVVKFVSAVERGSVSEALVARGAHLLSVAGDSDMTAAQYGQLYTAMVDLLRNTGRALQAARLVKQLTPEGRMLCLQQAIQNINDARAENAQAKADRMARRKEIREAFRDADRAERAKDAAVNKQKNAVGSISEIVVPEEMWQAYREATTDKARDAVISDIQKYVADQIPSTLYDKWTALRYLNMLGNFKTQIRNIASNTGSALLYTAKNRVKALVEAPVYGISKALNRATDGKVAEYERTSPLTPASVADPMLFGQAWKDYTQFKDEILGDTKFKENLRGQYAREIEAKRQIWKLNGQWGTKEDSNTAAKAIRKSAETGMALLRGYDKVTSFAMEQGDAIFGRFAYAQALSGYLRANGVKSSTFENVDAELMNRARAYAIQQAQEATFRDTNLVSTYVSGFDRNAPRGVKMFTRGLLAFRKTPANIGVRIEQFSPLGVLNMFADIIGKTSGFDISGNDIVEAASKTLTGTGLLYAGFLAAANGLIRGAGGDDDKEKTLDELAGKQDYSIKIGGKWYDISWLAPSSVPFLIGANIFDISERNNDPGFIEALLYITDPMIKTSMLSGLNDAIDTIKWSDAPLEDMVITNLFGYLTQGLSNSLIRQAEQAANKETTYTYIDEESWMPDIMQRVLGKWSQGIPGWDYNQAVMVDELGRTVDKGETAERIFNAFFNPAYYSEEAQNPVVDELQYLYELTQADPTLSEINVVPRWGDKSYSYRDKSGKKVTVRFTAEQYEEYSITRGTAITAMLTDLFKSQTYNEMTDEEKAKAVQSVIQTATLYAEAESKTGYVYQKGENKLLDLAFDAKLPASEVFQAKAYRDDLNEMDASANVKMSHFDNYVSHKGWTDAQKKAVLEAYGSFSTTMRGDTDRYDELTEYIGKDKALTVVDGVGKLEPIGDAKQVSDAQRIRAIAKMPLSDQEKWDAFAVYRDDDWRIAFFRKAEINPSVYAAYLEAAPEYRLTADGKKSSAWNKTTIWNWLRTTEYSYAVRQKVAQIALMDKPKEDGKK